MNLGLGALGAIGGLSSSLTQLGQTGTQMATQAAERERDAPARAAIGELTGMLSQKPGTVDKDRVRELLVTVSSSTDPSIRSVAQWYQERFNYLANADRDSEVAGVRWKVEQERLTRNDALSEQARQRELKLAEDTAAFNRGMAEKNYAMAQDAATDTRTFRTQQLQQGQQQLNMQQQSQRRLPSWAENLAMTTDMSPQQVAEMGTAYERGDMNTFKSIVDTAARSMQDREMQQVTQAQTELATLILIPRYGRDWESNPEAVTYLSQIASSQSNLPMARIQRTAASNMLQQLQSQQQQQPQPGTAPHAQQAGQSTPLHSTVGAIPQAMLYTNPLTAGPAAAAKVGGAIGSGIRSGLGAIKSQWQRENETLRKRNNQ